jgi:hypothetical protein
MLLQNGMRDTPDFPISGMVDRRTSSRSKAGAHPLDTDPPAERLLGLGAGMEPPSPSIVTPQDQPALLPEQQPRLVMLGSQRIPDC